MNINNDCVWDNMFETGLIPVDMTDISLCAIGLVSWGHCCSGHKPPPKFGEIMAQISNRLGSATPEFLSEYIDNYLLKDL